MHHIINTRKRRRQESGCKEKKGLQRSVGFLCYCLIFIVNYLNHSAKNKIEWDTPMGKCIDIRLVYQCFDSVFGNLLGNMIQRKNCLRKFNTWTVCWFSMGSYTGEKYKQGREIVKNVVTYSEADDNKPKVDIGMYSRFELSIDDIITQSGHRRVKTKSKK